MGESALHTTGDDLLGQEDVQEEGGQEHDDDGREHARPVTGVLHGVDHGVQADGDGTHLVGVGEDQRQEVLVPDVDEIEDGDGNQTGLCHGEHDLPVDLGGRTAVDLRRFLKAAGQVCKEVQQENGGVGHIDADVQEQQNQTVLDAVVHQMQLGNDAEQGQHDHGNGNTHGGHEAGLDGGIAEELEAAEDIGTGGTDDNQQCAGDQRVDQGVGKDLGNVLAAPCLGIVLKVEAGGEFAHFTGEDLGGGGQAGEQHPAQQDEGEQHPGDDDDIAGEHLQLVGHLAGKTGTGIGFLAHTFHNCCIFQCA